MKEIQQWNHFSHYCFIWKYKFDFFKNFYLYALRLKTLMQGFIDS